MRVLLTAGPTREYLDDVRYLSNASSGQMGYALAEAGHAAGWEVVLVSGPVDVAPPAGVSQIDVLTTAEMKAACDEVFPSCDGVIAAAAVCDYRPVSRIEGKLAKTGGPITFEMIETDDVLAGLGRKKSHRWVVGFALEAQNPRENALQKLRRKNCDLIVLNSPAAIGSPENRVEVLAEADRLACEAYADEPSRSPHVLATFEGPKPVVATQLIRLLGDRFAGTPRATSQSFPPPT